MKQCSPAFPVSLLFVSAGEETSGQPHHRKDIDALLIASMLFQGSKAGSDRQVITIVNSGKVIGFGYCSGVGGGQIRQVTA